MERAVDAPVLEIAARGNDLAVECIVVVSLHPTRVRRLAGSDQRFESLLADRDVQLEGEVTAARRPALVVRGATMGGGAGIV